MPPLAHPVTCLSNATVIHCAKGLFGCFCLQTILKMEFCWTRWWKHQHCSLPLHTSYSFLLGRCIFYGPNHSVWQGFHCICIGWEHIYTTITYRCQSCCSGRLVSNSLIVHDTRVLKFHFRQSKQQQKQLQNVWLNETWSYLKTEPKEPWEKIHKQ